MNLRFFVLFLLLLIACPAFATVANLDSLFRLKGPMKAHRTTESMSVDGILSEEVWRSSEGVSSFTQREPNEGYEPTEKTVVHIAYDEAAIYVAARCFDRSPDSMVVRLSRKDANWDSDMFAFFIDPYYDRRSGFYFAVDAAGTLYDGILYNDDWDDNSWDGVWDGKVHRDPQGWSLEMRIPFSQLRFQEKPQYTWGVNFRRDVARRNERDYITFTPKNGSGFVSRFIDLVGIENVSRGQQIEVLPYVTTRAEYIRPSNGDPFNDGSKYSPRVGADFKMGLSSNLTLDATVNPDFGQVEIDPAVINLSDVESFFQEKRPFFIEGSTIFGFGSGGANNNWSFNWPGLEMLYSRRIGRAPQGNTPDDADYADAPVGTEILGAAKLTGKVGENWNVGTIQAITRREFAEIERSGVRSEVEVEPLTYYGIARAQKEFDGGRHALGFMTTAAVRSFDDDRLRDQINKDALNFGLDGWTFLDSSKIWVLSGWAAASRVSGNTARLMALQQNSQHYFQRPDADHVELDSNATSLSGYAARLKLNKQKGNWYTNASLGVIDPGYEPNDVGFMGRTDVINGHWTQSYRWTEPGSWYRYIELGGATFRNYDFGGNKTWEGYFHFGYIQFPNFWSIDWSAVHNPQTFNNRRTRGGPLTLNPAGMEYSFFVRTDGNKSIVASLNWYTYQSKWSTNWNIGTTINWRPAANVSLSFSPSFERDLESSQWVNVFDDPNATATFGRRYVFATMYQTTFSSSIRLNWTFTPTLSLQMYVQPLISAGDFYDFKELARPKSYDFNVYGRDGSTFSEDTYTADPDGGGPSPTLDIGNPDFNFKSIRGNAILRWEYLPGSTLYFVWTQSRSDDENIGDFQFRRAFNRLLDTTPDNIFMIKCSYWWNL